MKIKVLVDGNKRVIDTKDLDKEIHSHLSGRTFSSDEIKNFKKAK